MHGVGILARTYVTLAENVRRHVPPSTFDGWESMCSAPNSVYRVRICFGGTIALPTAPPSIPRVMVPPTERFGIWGVGRAVVRISDVDIPRGENPCWWGHPLTNGQSALGLIDWGQRGGRRWPHRVQLSPPLHFGVGFRHH